MWHSETREGAVMDWIRWGAKICAIVWVGLIILSFDRMAPRMVLDLKDVFGGLAIIFGVIALGHWLWVRVRKRAA